MDLKDFEKNVSQSLVRHKSILDVLSKLDESSSRVSRSVIKSATQCGCITINAKKQELPKDLNYSELSNFLSNHVEGSLCDSCKDIIKSEIGNHLFYTVALCQSLDLNFSDLVQDQQKKLFTLGKFSLL